MSNSNSSWILYLWLHVLIPPPRGCGYAYAYLVLLDAFLSTCKFSFLSDITILPMVLFNFRYFVQQGQKSYPLRPELIESTYWLYKATRNPRLTFIVMNNSLLHYHIAHESGEPCYMLELKHYHKGQTNWKNSVFLKWCSILKCRKPCLFTSLFKQLLILVLLPL